MTKINSKNVMTLRMIHISLGFFLLAHWELTVFLLSERCFQIDFQFILLSKGHSLHHRTVGFLWLSKIHRLEMSSSF